MEGSTVPLILTLGEKETERLGMDCGVFVRAVCGESRTYGNEGGSRLYVTCGGWAYPPYLFHDLWVYWSYPLRSISQDFDRIRNHWCSI